MNQVRSKLWWLPSFLFGVLSLGTFFFAYAIAATYGVQAWAVALFLLALAYGGAAAFYLRRRKSTGEHPNNRMTRFSPVLLFLIAVGLFLGDGFGTQFARLFQVAGVIFLFAAAWDILRKRSPN